MRRRVSTQLSIFHGARTAIICGMLTTIAAEGAGDDPVYQRYEKKIVPSAAIRFDTDQKRVALTAPATPADVKAGKAVFTLAGLGEARIWKLPRCPTPGTWTTLRQFPQTDRTGKVSYDNWGHVIQAEELRVDGQWRRYFGLITKHGVAVVPGAEIDLWLSTVDEIYRCHFEFDDLKASDAEIRGCVSYGFGFALGTPPPRLTVAELNREIPPLGGKDTEERLRQLIRETCLPPPANPAPGPEPAWSAVAGGLQARIIYIGQGGYTGYVVMVELRNVSPATVVVPTAHPEAPVKPGLFELRVRSGSAEWQTIQGFGSYRMPELDLGLEPEDQPKPAEPVSYPTVALAPGHAAVVYLSGTEDPLIAKASEVKIVLEQNEATAPKNGWRGRVETPPAAARWDDKTLDHLKGSLPLPAFYPDFSKCEFLGGNMSGGESGVTRLGISNRELLLALELFDREAVRREFERRMTADGNETMKLLLASVAAGSGSKTAALFLLDALKKTDFRTVSNVHTVLDRLLSQSGNPQPAWLIAMVEAALSDQRYATGVEEAGWGNDTRYTLSDLAEKLLLTLGDVKCRQTLPLLVEKVKRTESRYAIFALGAMGDPLAIPVLLEVITKTGKSAKYDSGVGLSPENFSRAVEALANLKATEAVPTLLEYIEFPEVIEALERIGDRRALPALRGLVAAEGKVLQAGKNLDPEVAHRRLVRARIALAAMDEGDAVPRLCALLSDKSFGEFDRREVVWRLGRRADSRAIPLLLQAIKTDPSGAVVNQAITVLSAFKFKAAVEGLLECFDADFKGKADWKRAYEPEMYHDNIAETLRTITGRNIGTDKQQWLEWWQREGRLDTGLK